MSSEVKALLSDVGGRLPEGTRLQLVREPGGDVAEASGVRVRVVDSLGAADGHLSRTFTSLEALLDEDWGEAGLAESTRRARLGEGDWSWSARPLLLVCAHGARDACCARQGVGLFLAIKDALDLRPQPGWDPEVWQTSHLGGHRFAAVAVSLPDAYVYGRLQAVEADALVEDLARGELPPLARVRGNANLAPAVQAAELFEREHLGVRGVRSASVVGHAERGGGVHEVHVLVDGRRVEVEVTPRSVPLAVLGSCADATSREMFPFELMALRDLGPG